MKKKYYYYVESQKKTINHITMNNNINIAEIFNN